jgi:hypoxanthine phosphoribosyltransferase
MPDSRQPATPKVVISAEQIQKRVREIGRQISDDYKGKTIHALGILENGFVFFSDLVRNLDVPVICQFIKPQYRDDLGGMLEIFFSHELEIRDQHVLLVEGVVHSGITTEFLMNDLRGRSAASVKVATLLDRQSARRVQLQPDYFGFLVDRTYLMGYGLGSAQQTGRNLPYLAVGESVAGFPSSAKLALESGGIP